MDVYTRLFDKSDFEKLSQLKELYSDLGYPVSEDKLENRLNSIYRHNDYYILLLIKDDKIIGFSGMCKMYFYEYDGEYMRILAFVVSSKYRKRGYGKLLLNKSEELASSLNCKAITLNSGITMDRKSAHNFYKRNGYNNGTLGFSKAISKSL